MLTIYSNRIVFPLTLGAVLLAASGGKDAAPPANGEPARQITLAPSKGAEPQLNDAPVKAEAVPVKAPVARKAAPKAATQAPPPAPSVIVRELTPAPAAAPAGPPPAPTGVVAAGTSIAVHPTARICTSTHRSGDRFTATLRETVTGSNGATIPAGSTVVFRVVESARSENSRDNIRLTYDVVAVKVGDESYDLQATVTQASPVEKVRAQSTADQAKKVGTGAAIGAIAGQILGKNTRSTVIGAVIGGAAGGAVAAGTADYDGCLPADANITLSLSVPLRIKVVVAK